MMKPEEIHQTVEAGLDAIQAHLNAIGAEPEDVFQTLVLFNVSMVRTLVGFGQATEGYTVIDVAMETAEILRQMHVRSAEMEPALDSMPVKGRA